MQGCTRFSDSTGKRASVSLSGVRGSITQGVGFEFCLEGWKSMCKGMEYKMEDTFGE